jgi:hypothetical protein
VASDEPAVAEFCADSPLGLSANERVKELLAGRGGFETRVTRSQVALRRKRGFAYLWLPGRYLRKPDAEIVLTIALGRHEDSPRFKEVVHPSGTQWIHHLEIRDVADLDDEVGEWLGAAFERAG